MQLTENDEKVNEKVRRQLLAITSTIQQNLFLVSSLFH